MTIEQFAGMINDMAGQGLLFYAAGTIRDSRDLWRMPKNMDLLCEAAQIAARHYIENGEAGENT